MVRKAFLIQARPGMAVEYERRHNPIWPELQEALKQHGAHVYADDPLFSVEELRDLGYTPLPADQQHLVEAIIVQSYHSAYQQFDFARFVNCRVVLDGRHALPHARIEALGMSYLTIGGGDKPGSQRASITDEAAGVK